MDTPTPARTTAAKAEEIEQQTMRSKERNGMKNIEAGPQNFDEHERLLGNWRSEAFEDGDRWNFRDGEPQGSSTKPLTGGRQTS